MRPPAHLALGTVALLAFGIGPTSARAQGYAPGPRPTYTAQAPAPTYYVQPRAYYVQPRTYTVQPQSTRYYYTAPRRRGLLRMRKYPASNTNYTNYVLVDPNNPHWTFDYDDWMAHNF
jgi:hypothetical protein